MKKLLAILLAMISVLGLFAGCKPKQVGNPDRYGPDGKMNITIGLPETLLVEDYETNAFTLWLEEKAGVNLKFHRFPSSAADYRTQLSVLALDQNSKLPDILVNFEGLAETAWKKYGKDEYFLDLTEYFEDKEGKGKAYWDAVKESGISEAWVNDVLRRCKDDEGRYYCFPRIETTVIDTMDYMPFINQDWLTAVGKKMPTNPDELYEVLKAFKTQDPNKNGFTDEMPLVGSTSNGTAGSDIINWIINMFVYYDDTAYFNLNESGTAHTVPFTSEAYRQAMIYARKLHSEGLLHYDMDYTEISSKLSSKTAVVGVAVAHPTLVFTPGKKTIDPYKAMPIWGTAVRKEYRNTLECFITEGALDGLDENPEVVDKCWEVLCIMASKEGSYRQRYGEKGVDWVDADPGAVGFLGQPADIKIINDNAFAGEGNECWKNVAASLLPNAENESVQLDDKTDDWTKKKLTLLKELYENFEDARARNPKYLAPKLIRTEEEKEETQNERSNCQATIPSYRVKFISGELDPNKPADWNKYIQELKDNGLQTWINQSNRIYTARYKELVLSGNYGKW